MSIKQLFLCLCVILCSIFVCGAQTARGFIQEAFRLEDSEKVITYLSAATQKLSIPEEKKTVLVFIARLQEQLGNYESASKTYYEAASLQPLSLDSAVLLDAARCALSLGDTASAENYINRVLLTTSRAEVTARARLYACWVQLCNTAVNTFPASSDEPIALLKTYATQKTDITPIVLLTLWWVGDPKTSQDAAQNLQKNYPKTPEAAIVRGDIVFFPAPFWYFAPRIAVALIAPSDSASAPHVVSSVGTATKKPTASSAQENTANTVISSGTSEKVFWQQLGFFKEEINAQRLASELKQKGFIPEIVKQPRPSGTIYFAVMVKENAQNTIGSELKNAGFESYPVFE